MFDAEKQIVEKTGGHFYAEESSEGWAVFKDGGETKYDDGSVSLGLCFPIVLVSEFVAENQHEAVCKAIAEALNETGKLS